MACRVRAIVAVCDDWGIGIDGHMLVSNREDMRHFVAQTVGHAVVMGRRTLDAMPGGRPLRDRRNVVLTHDPGFSREGVEVAHDLDEALRMVADEDEAWVIGGGQVYREALSRCEDAVVTHNHCTLPADARFPDLGREPGWRLERTWGASQTPEGVAFEFARYVNDGLGA